MWTVWAPRRGRARLVGLGRFPLDRRHREGRLAPGRGEDRGPLALGHRRAAQAGLALQPVEPAGELGVLAAQAVAVGGDLVALGGEAVALGGDGRGLLPGPLQARPA
jgi:hypothetical protein